METFLSRFIEAVDFQTAIQILAETKLADLPEWDSLAALGVIVMCDFEYGMTITGTDLKRCQTVGDIYARLQPALA